MLVKITGSIKSEIESNLKSLYYKKFSAIRSTLISTSGLGDRVYDNIFGKIDTAIKTANIPSVFINRSSTITINRVEGGNYQNNLHVGEYGVRLSLSGERPWPMGTAPVVTPVAQLDYYRGMTLKPHDSWGELFDLFKNYADEVTKNSDELALMGAQVGRLLAAHPSLNKAYEAWPSLGGLLSQSTIDRMNKVPERKSAAKETIVIEPPNEDSLNNLGAALAADKFQSLNKS